MAAHFYGVKPLRPDLPNFTTDFSAEWDGTQFTTWVYKQDTRPWTPQQALHAGFHLTGNDPDAREWSVPYAGNYEIPDGEHSLKTQADQEKVNRNREPIPTPMAVVDNQEPGDMVFADPDNGDAILSRPRLAAPCDAE